MPLNLKHPGNKIVPSRWGQLVKGRTISFPADFPPILMVPPQEHCQGKRRSPQFQTRNSPWCATKPLAASSPWLVQSNSPAPSPKSHLPAGASVELEMRRERETLQKMTLWFPWCIVGTRGRDIPQQHNDTLKTGIYKPQLDANGSGAPLPWVPLVLLAHTETLRRLGMTKLNPLVSRDTWDLRAAWAFQGCVATF